MPAASRPISVEQGTTWRLSFTWFTGDPGALGPAFDLTGASARFQVRQTRASPPLLSASTTDGRIVLGGVAGTIAITLSAADTALLVFPVCTYDLKMTLANGDVVRLLEGAASVDLDWTSP